MFGRYMLAYLGLTSNLLVFSDQVCTLLRNTKIGKKKQTYKTVLGSVLFECKALCQMCPLGTSFSLGLVDRVCRLNKATSDCEENIVNVNQNQNSGKPMITAEELNKTADSSCIIINCPGKCDIVLAFRKACEGGVDFQVGNFKSSEKRQTRRGSNNNPDKKQTRRGSNNSPGKRQTRLGSNNSPGKRHNKHGTTCTPDKTHVKHWTNNTPKETHARGGTKYSHDKRHGIIDAPLGILKKLRIFQPTTNKKSARKSMCYTCTQNRLRFPRDGIAYGKETRGALYWSVVAHTKHGPVFGKARDNTSCWYTYRGSEGTVSKFSWLTAARGKIAPVINTGSPPHGVVSFDPKENEDGRYKAAVAVTKYGLIPGKAIWSQCTYGYRGLEYTTENFLWLVCRDIYESRKTAAGTKGNTVHEPKHPVKTSRRKRTAIKSRQGRRKGLQSKCYTYKKKFHKTHTAYGWQNDGEGTWWSAVAHTKHGDIAGKAQRGKCWYGYQGSQYTCKKFSFIAARRQKIFPVINTGSLPPSAVSVGPENNEDGDYFAVIAVSGHGLIPGKAKGNMSWYVYRGKEYSTCDFLWLVCQ